MGLAGTLGNLLGSQSAIPVGQQMPLQYINTIDPSNLAYQQLQQQNAGQNSLAQALMAQQQGGGPNPAASMLTQAQGQNAAQAAGVYANNRAINPALAARQASMLQANSNQQAAGQASTLRAQQQLGAQSQLSNLYNNQANQNLGLYSTSLAGNAAQNTASNQANAINAGVAAGNQASNNQLMGNIIGAVGAVGGKAFGSVLGGGGGGTATGGPGAGDPSSSASGTGDAGKIPGTTNNGSGGVDNGNMPSPSMGGQEGGGFIPGQGSPAESYPGVTFNAYDGGMVPGSLNNYSDPSDEAVKKGPSEISQFLSLAHALGGLISGGRVPGTPQVKGNSIKNDKVPALLSPGEVVVPRTSASDPEKAKEFIDHIMKKQGTTGGYGEMKAKHRELAARIAELEKRLGKKAS